MATSKQSFVRATEPQCSASAQREEETHVKAPLTTMYVHSVPAPGLQPYPQAQPGALQDATVVPLFLPRMCSNSTLPSLTLHIASGAVLQQQRLVAPATSVRPKSVGKHICPQCGKDCLKPSVLEKHLRCHTGERPYPCTTCGISFKTQSNLYKHKRTQAHARLSSESDKGTFSSQESTESLKDNYTSLSGEINCGDSAVMKRGKEVLPVVTIPGQVDSTENKTMSIEWALRNAAMVGLSTTPVLQDNVNSSRKSVELLDGLKNSPSIPQTGAESEDGCTPLTPNRMPLQRQEALFSKPWDSPMSRGKSQSHDSTDSGFSDSSEHHSSSSPGASLNFPSMESLTETTIEPQEPGTSQTPSEMTPDPKCKVSIQEKQKLEERISKLIYENSVLVDNKQLETVRPRKTILSKQGSIDLPVPYTYKDSFHFEIKSSKHSSSAQNPDRGGGAIHGHAPTQHSTGLEHAPLTRSSSLPFPMGGKPSDGAMNLNLSRRCSAGHVYPLRSSDQQAPGHRSLVRQVAVDCLPTAEVSLAERDNINSFSSDGDSTDVGTEPTIKGNYRKKARKFDYTKWHTYKGGTFTKLYSTEKDCTLKAKKTALNSDQSLEIQISQQKDNRSMSLSLTSCSVVSLKSDLKVSCNSFETYNEEDMGKDEITMQHTGFHIPSERKKQRTGSDVQMLSISDSRTGEANENLHSLITQLPLSTCATYSSITVPAQKVNMEKIHPQGSIIPQLSNPSQFLGNTLSPAFCFINVSGTSGTPSGSISSPTVPEAKTSFPPKYQLKIPCSTDGVSASCSGSALAHNTCSNVPDLRQSRQTTAQCHLENSTLPSKQCQGVSIVTTFDQSKQDILCATTSMPILSLSCSELNQTNTLSKFLTKVQSTTPTSISLVSPPVQHQISLLQSNCATCLVENLSTGSVSSTSENIQIVTATNTSTVICGSESGVETCSSVNMTPTVQNHPASPVNESGKPLAVDAKFTMDENTLKSMASKMATDDFQGSHSEEKMMLLNGSTQAQNTFYVRTADLQIVMQLISDEQLALIEPHIETTTSSTVTHQTTFSQEVYSKDATHVCMAQEMVNNAELSKKNGYNCESAGPANKAEIVCSLNSQNSKSSTIESPQCFSSWSHPQTKVHISPLVDYKNKSTGQLYKPQRTFDNSQERKSAGFEVTTETHHKLLSGDNLSEPRLVDSNYSIRGNDKPQNSSVHNRDSDNFSEDQTFIETSTDKELFCLMEPNPIQTTTNTKPVEPNETGHHMPVTLSGNCINIQTKIRTCIYEKNTSTAESHHTQKELSSAIQHSHYKAHWTACGNSDLDTREMRACDKCKLNCKHGDLVTEKFYEGQTPTQNDFKQAFALGPGDFGNDTFSEVKASCPMLNRTTISLEDSSRCGDVHTQHTNLEIFTGPLEDGTLKSLRFLRDPGKQSKESIPKNSESGDGEAERDSTEVADKNTDHGKEDNRKEDAAPCEKHQTSAQAQAREVSLSVSGPVQHDNTEASVCTNMVSQDFQHQGQEESNNNRKDSIGDFLENSPSQKASQNTSSLPKYTNETCRHLLVHPLKVNTMQNEFQKETQQRGAMSYWIYSKENQVQTSKHEMSGATVSTSILQNNCGASKSKTVNASIASSCSAGPSSHQMSIQELHSPQICPPAIHSNPTYLGIGSYLEHEDSNSSSDDEQKLVIEL
ncbi:zinc finger protein 831 [Puntigrus tetrazona]|uniref:zinc finger protein 831 n=1 Tax=Puntigrus tetrazona TaxID=1606681 RepID=UPI001C8A63CF|nr:zinc finger protein 831 [Puntigrus tetrazona]XP_043108469.1 zinc finger protein 831 [Puntigrus tetrazona]